MKIILTALLALVALTGQGQEVKMNEPSFSDYLTLLHFKGYKAYSFDISMFEGKRAKLVVKECSNGKEIHDNLLANFLFTLPIHDKLVIGFVPTEKDSTSQYVFELTGGGTFSLPLNLRPIPGIDGDVPHYQYESVPFELVPPFKVGEFIPFVLYGSWWYDEAFNITRFCGDDSGDDFIKPDLSSSILKDIPHYFVLGIVVEE